MDAVTWHEVAARREMLAQATRLGGLEAELIIIRVTLKSLLPSLDKYGDWRADELRDLIDRIDLALESKKEGL